LQLKAAQPAGSQKPSPEFHFSLESGMKTRARTEKQPKSSAPHKNHYHKVSRLLLAICGEVASL
jgi:hypothetical protein